MIPQLKDIAHAVCKLCGVAESALRLGFDPPAMQAVGMFAWMAGEATEYDAASLALYLGRLQSIVETERAAFAVRVTQDFGLRDLMQEELVAVAVVAEVNRRRNVPVRASSAYEIAQRIVSGRVSLMRVGIDEHVMLASAYLSRVAELKATRAEVADLTAAAKQFSADQHSSGERASRERLIAAAVKITSTHKEFSA